MRLKGKPPGQFASKIGRRIRWIREIQDVSLNQLADRTQMTAQTLARYERGGTAVGGLDIPTNAIEAIATALNVSPTRLCGPLNDFAWLVQEQVAQIEAPNVLISRDPDAPAKVA